MKDQNTSINLQDYYTAEQARQVISRNSGREIDIRYLHQTLPGLRSHDAVVDSLQSETLGPGPVAGSMPFGGGGEGVRGDAGRGGRR